MDVIANFLTIIRNGISAAHPLVRAPYSRLNLDIARILKEEGFIRDFAIEGESYKRTIVVTLKYVGGESVIHEITRISTPGRRTYSAIKQVRPVVGGLGISILSTSKGVMTQHQATTHNVGGELLCKVW